MTSAQICQLDKTLEKLKIEQAEREKPGVVGLEYFVYFLNASIVHLP